MEIECAAEEGEDDGGAAQNAQDAELRGGIGDCAEVKPVGEQEANPDGEDGPFPLKGILFP